MFRMLKRFLRGELDTSPGSVATTDSHFSFESLENREMLSNTPLYALNIGGPTLSYNNVLWQSDSAAIAGVTTTVSTQGSAPQTTTDTINTSDPSVSVTGRSYELLNQNLLTLDPTDYAAPSTLFSSWRYDASGGGNLAYNFAVTPGKYRVDLFFAEPTKTGANQRVFDVRLEGTLVLDNFDIYAASGGTDVALGRSFVVTSNSQLNVLLNNQTDLALLSGIRISTASTDVDRSFNPSTLTATGINQINSGDVVEFQPGNYQLSTTEIDALLSNAGNDRVGVTFRGVPGQTVFDFSGQTNYERLNFDKFATGDSSHFDNMTFDGLTFLNGALRVRGTNTTIQNSVFDGFAGKTTIESDRIISIWFSGGSTIQNNYVHWNNTAENINPIGAGESDNTYIGYNKLVGRLRRGIQFWRSESGVTEYNDIERWDVTPGDATGNEGPFGEDHGIYLHDDSNMVVAHNTVRGWSDHASGGSLKLKNVDHIEVDSNEFYTSGILGRGEVTYFDHVWIHDNNIYGGPNLTVSIWTDGTIPTSIRIADNFVLGKITAQESVNSTFNNTVQLGGGVAGGVYNNQALTYDLKAVINTSGNTAPSTTNIPPRAVLDTAATNQGVAVVINLLANDSDENVGNTLSIQSVTPGANGAVVNNGNGTVTYTPSGGFAGHDAFSYLLSDGQGGTFAASVFVEVNPLLPGSNAPPVAVNDSGSTNEDNAVLVSVLANDTDPDVGDSLSVQSVTQGSNGSVLNIGDGTVIYAPNANFHGNDSFTYTLSDGNGGTDIATVNMTVHPVNDVPVAVNDSATTEEGVAVVVSVLANDSDPDAGDSLSVQSVTQGASGAVVNNGNGTVTYTPSAGFDGIDAFTYTVSDGNGGTDTATVNVTVTKIPSPTLNQSSWTLVSTDSEELVGENGAAVNAFDGNTSTIWHTQWQNGAPTHPHQIVIDLGATYTLDTLRYLPRQTGVNGRIANYEFYVSTNTTNWGAAVATGAFLNSADEQTASLTPKTGRFVRLVALSEVNGNAWTSAAELNLQGELVVNSAPVAVADGAMTNEDTAVVINVVTNDTDVDAGDSLSVLGVTQGTSGAVVNNGNGTVTYTPNANFHGNDSFTYLLSDGNGGTDVGTVNVTVQSVNDAPVAGNDSATTDEDLPVVVNLLANDSDIDTGDTLSVQSVTQGSNGAVINNGNGTATYTPNTGFSGNDAFSYTLSDGQGGTDVAMVNVTVNAVHDTPGDFNHNGTVDGVDLAIWQGDYGLGTAGDADLDGDTDGFDFLLWQRNFTIPAPLAALSEAGASEPEALVAATTEEATVAESSALLVDAAMAWEPTSPQALALTTEAEVAAVVDAVDAVLSELAPLPIAAPGQETLTEEATTTSEPADAELVDVLITSGLV